MKIKNKNMNLFMMVIEQNNLIIALCETIIYNQNNSEIINVMDNKATPTLTERISDHTEKINIMTNKLLEDLEK